MSNYEIGAYDALQWAWKILGNADETAQSIDEVRVEIINKLKIIREGKGISFKENISK
jgi:hypothetical protein